MIIEITIAIITALIIVQIIKELRAVKALKYYSSQGIKTIYKPMSGYSSYLSPDHPHQDQLVKLEDLIDESLNNSEKAVVVNSGIDTRPLMIVLDPYMVGDLFKKEVKYLDKTPIGYGIHVGFSDESGQAALKTRNILNEFFGYENSLKMRKYIDKIALKEVEDLTKQYWPNRDFDQSKEVNLRKFIDHAVTLITDRIIIGEEEPLKIGEEFAADIFTKIIDDLSATRSNFLNILSFGLIARWKLTPNLHKTYKKFEKGFSDVIHIFQRRLNQPDSQSSEHDFSLTSILVDHVRNQRVRKNRSSSIS